MDEAERERERETERERGRGAQQWHGTKPKGERIIYISPLSSPLLSLPSLFFLTLFSCVGPFFRLRIFRSELKSVSPPKTYSLSVSLSLSLSLSISLGVVYLSERVAPAQTSNVRSCVPHLPTMSDPLPFLTSQQSQPPRPPPA